MGIINTQSNSNPPVNNTAKVIIFKPQPELKPIFLVKDCLLLEFTTWGKNFISYMKRRMEVFDCKQKSDSKTYLRELMEKKRWLNGKYSMNSWQRVIFSCRGAKVKKLGRLASKSSQILQQGAQRLSWRNRCISNRW